MIRIDPVIYDDLIIKDGCSPLVMRGRKIRGFVYVDEESVKTRKPLDYWVGLAIAFNAKANSFLSENKIEYLRYVLNLLSMRHTTMYLVLSCFSFFSCGPSVVFTGKSYPPTRHVDIYFHVADIKKNYKIIGKSEGRAWLLTDDDKIKKRMVAAAKRKGADGVIFTEATFELVSTPNKDDTTSGSNVSTATQTNSGNTIQNLIRAYFIKYD